MSTTSKTLIITYPTTEPRACVVVFRHGRIRRYWPGRASMTRAYRVYNREDERGANRKERNR
jgi:hypothetical protein